jgi:putative sterol carrier protein
MHAFMDQELPTQLKANPLLLQGAGIKAQAVQVVVDGLGTWTFQFDPQGQVRLDSGSTSLPTCTIETKLDVFDGLLKGSVNVATAYLFRKIRIKGDTQLAIQLGLALKKVFRS